MALSLVVAGAAALVAVGASVVLMRRWVLEPLDALREQLRDISRGGHRAERVIVPAAARAARGGARTPSRCAGPCSAEADAARAADEGLAQEGPVVSAIRADLATVSDPIAVGLEVHGRCRGGPRRARGRLVGRAALDGDRTALLLIDVAGHGELAGLVLQRLRSVMSVSLRSGFDAGTALTRGAVSFTDAADGRFATALVAVVDPAPRRVSWANAGHPSGWLLPEGDCDRRTTLEATGPLAVGPRRRVGDPHGPLRCPTTSSWRGPTGSWRPGRPTAETTDEDLARIVSGIGTREPASSWPGCSPSSARQSPEWRARRRHPGGPASRALSGAISADQPIGSSSSVLPAIGPRDRRGTSRHVVRWGRW